MITPTVGKDVEQLNLSYTAAGTTTLENSLAVPRAGQQTAIIWPNNSTQKAYAQEYVLKKLV